MKGKAAKGAEKIEVYSFCTGLLSDREWYQQAISRTVWKEKKKFYAKGECFAFLS